MYGFLILLPLTLISLAIGALVASSVQVADYVAYIADIPDRADFIQKIWTNKHFWIKIGSHLLAYVILCFVLIATVRTISAPLPEDRPAALRFFQLVLEAVFVAVPSTVLLWISSNALSGDWKNWIHWAAIAVLCIGLLATITITAKRRPLELYSSSVRPFTVAKTDVVAILSIIAIGATIAAFALDPLDSAHIVGMFPVLMLGTALTFLVLAAIFSRKTSPVAVISFLITAVLLLYLVDQTALPPREFRYKRIALPAEAGVKPGKVAVADVKALRKIPDLQSGFRQWLEHRRPAIEAYNKNGRAYPIFFVSAQGGGMYAAYHPALSLARLTDECPEFAHHLFGISSVSGGSLGAAVYAELLRTLPAIKQNDPAAAADRCTPTAGPGIDNVLQTKVHEFFNTDFLSPVIATALIFDVPSLVVPPLRFGQDRAKALELGFETAWKRLGIQGHADALAGDFLERWSPNGLAPALFMSTTGVNYGIPVLVSQIDWSHNPAALVQAKAPPKGAGAQLDVSSGGVLKAVLDRLSNPEEQLQVGVANILDFRPDLQLSTSTAVVLSARFPFVTPPGAIVENKQIVRQGLFQKTKVLELTDGGFYDNSGAIVARSVVSEMLRRLDRDEELAEFKDKVKLHLIRFTDTPARRHGATSEGGHFEFITPLVAYDAVRQSRGVLLANPPRRTEASDIFLLDEWYEGSLNWLLSRDTKVNIEKRSSWITGHENVVCCEVLDPKTEVVKRIPLTEEQAQEVRKSDLQVTPFVPNARPFERLFELVNKGADLKTAKQENQATRER